MNHLLTLYYYFCPSFHGVDLFLFFFYFWGFFSFRFYLLRLFETRRSGLVRVCCRCLGRDCITQVRRCLTGRLPTLTNSLYLHRLVVSKEIVREVMQNTVNKPNKNSIKKKHGHTKREWGSALVCASCV